MPNRREFITQTAAAGVGAAILGSAATSAAAPKDSAKAARSLRILILGGTGFIGSNCVRVALDRGHKVAVFSRGKRAPDLPSEVEHLIGDRGRDLESIKHRDWDAVIDTPTFVPSWVRTLGESLKGRVKHYTFISSVAVYDNSGARENGTDEKSQLLEYKGDADPYSISGPADVDQYARLKVLCEREAEKQFPGKTLSIRPTVIVGPGDIGGGAFTYLCARMDAGGEMLVAGEPLMPMQMIDVRDMTAWMIRMIESGKTGPFNAAGPALPMGWAEMLGAIRGQSSVPVKLTWVPVSWLTERKVSPNSDLLFWPTGNGIPGLFRMSNDKARAKGLAFRPLSVSAADTLAWYKSLSPTQQAQVLWPSDKDWQHRNLKDSMARERELLQEWHARNTG